MKSESEVNCIDQHVQNSEEKERGSPTHSSQLGNCRIAEDKVIKHEEKKEGGGYNLQSNIEKDFYRT